MTNKQRRLSIIIVVLIIVLAVLVLGCIAFAEDSKGLVYSPKLNEDNNTIQYDPDNNASVSKMTSVIDDFLKEYRRNTVDAEHRIYCYFGQPPSESQVCDVPVDDFHPCTSSNNYNYESGGPCVFLQFPKILNWTPQFFNLKDLPVEMPGDLKQHVGVVNRYPEAKIVWVACRGITSEDEKNMGPVQYIPRRGFPAYYFPFTNKPGYLSPLVAVLFENPKKGVDIGIQCQMWARNIDDNFSNIVKFSLRVG